MSVSKSITPPPPQSTSSLARTEGGEWVSAPEDASSKRTPKHTTQEMQVRDRKEVISVAAD